MGIVAGTAAVAGAGLSAYGQLQQGKATQAADNYAAQVATNNAAIATQKANWAAEEGVQSASKSQMDTAAKVGAIKANQGASGVTIGEGSSPDVVQSARTAGMLDAMTIRSNAAREAYGFQVDSSNQTAQSALYKASGKNAVKASKIGAASTILGAAASGSQYAGYLNSKSAFPTSLNQSVNPSASPSDSFVLGG